MTNDEINKLANEAMKSITVDDAEDYASGRGAIELVIRQAVTAALEEAAKVADQHGDDAKAHPMYPAYGMNSRVVAAGSIACAIRALKPVTP